MDDAPIYSIESLNVDASGNGLDVEKLRGQKFGELQDQLMNLDSAIVDVGASNVEEFLKRMQQYAGSHEEFDYFLIPVVKESKQQADTINTIPQKTLAAFADHGRVSGVLPADGGDAEEVLAEFTRVGVNDATLAAQLQREGAESFDASWTDLLACLAKKRATLTQPDLTAKRPS